MSVFSRSLLAQIICQYGIGGSHHLVVGCQMRILQQLLGGVLDRLHRITEMLNVTA